MKILFVVILHLSCCMPLAFSAFEKFERVFYLREYTCVEENVVFEDKKVHSKIECIFRCSVHSNCSGAFYQEEVRACIGCTSRNVNEFVQSPLNHVYYRRSEKGKLACSGKPCLMYRMVDTRQSWTQSEAYCNSLGGGLVQIHTAEIHEQVVNFVVPDGIMCAWIGGSVNAENGAFVWLDGSHLSDGFENWGPSQPSLDPGENCLEMMTQQNFKWNDLGCHWVCSSVCELN